MISFHDGDSDLLQARSNRTCENEERLRQEELATLLAFWSDVEIVVAPEVSKRLHERERDCELTLSGSLDLVKQNPNTIWSHVANALQELHVARLRLKTYDAKKIRETSNIWRGLVAFDKKRASSLALALTSFGALYYALGRYADAEEACLEATSLYREIFVANPNEGRESGFFTMICLAEVYFKTSRCDDAERALRMASGFLKKISVDRSKYEFILDRMRRKSSDHSQARAKGETKKDVERLRDEALNLCRDAARLWRWGNLQEAEFSYLKAIAVYRRPSSLENDVERRARLAETLDELGRLRCQPKLSKYEEAETCFAESATILRELSSSDSAYSDAFTAVLLNLATYFERQKRWKELEQTLREALDALDANDETFNPIAPSARVRLANLLRRSNRDEEALKEYRRALELWDKAQGGVAARCRLEIATARFRSAELLKRAKRWDEAEESYDVAHKLFRELSESDPENESYVHKLASSLNNLATLRSNSERGSISDLDYMVAERNYHEASTLYRRLNEKNPGSVDFEFATTLYNSAALHEKLNVVDKAEKEYLEALEIQRELAKNKPKEHEESIARTLNNLAVLYRSDSSDPLRFEKAEPLYEEALRIYENLERERPKTYGRKIVRTLRNLASLHSQDSDRKELAEEEYRRVVTLLNDLTRRFPNDAKYKSNLADVYARLGAVRFESDSFHDAELCYREAVAKYKELTRGNPRKYSVKLAATFVELSDLYQKTGALDAASRALESAIVVYKKEAREEPTDETLKLKLATAYFRLGATRQKMNQDERARESYLANLSILRELSREKSASLRLDMAQTHNKIATLCKKLNRFEDAEVGYKTAVELYRETESEERDSCKNDLVKALDSLAILYQESGRLAEAEKNFVDTLAIRRELAEENSSEHKTSLANFLFNFSNFYYNQGRLREAESYCREAASLFEEYASNDEQRRNFERASTKLREIRDEIEEREINEAFVKQSNERSLTAIANIRERVAYVYTSSAGDDARAERDFLAQEIFPRLASHCKCRGIEFVPIDLRQGNADETDDARVLALGLQEIARTRPFFIGLLGDEYGRILPSSTLEQNSEFQRGVLSDRNSCDVRMSALEAEFQFGVMCETSKVDALFALRSSEAKRAEGARREKPGTEPFKKLTILKRKIRAQKSHPTAEYKSIQELGEQVERALIAWIERLFDSRCDARQIVDDAQSAFAERLRQNYAPNQADYDALDSFLRADSSTLTIVGARGAGKSSLLANWSARVEREAPNLRVATFYVGANGREDAPSNVLNYLTREFTSDDSSDVVSNEKATLEERAIAFSAAVATFLKNNEEKELIVVVDALDRIVDVAKDLTWFPKLPKRAKYVLSTSEGDATQEVLARRGAKFYELKPRPTEERRSNDEILDRLWARVERDSDASDVCATSRQDCAEILELLAVSSCGLTLEELRRASGFSALKLLTILDFLQDVLIVQRARFRFADDAFRRRALELYAQETREARRRLIDLFRSDESLARRLEVPFQYFELEDWKALKASLFKFEVFDALYDGTSACDFCKYWNASANDQEEQFSLDGLFKLDISSKTSEQIGAYWRAVGDFARLLRDDQATEDAYCRALDVLRASAGNSAEFQLTLTRLVSFCRERKRFEDAERALRAGLETLFEQNASNKRNASFVALLVEASALCRRFKRLGEAEKLCDDASKLAESTRDERAASAATLETARVYFDLRRFDQAQTKYEDALNLLREQATYAPFVFERQVATTLDESARTAIELGNYEEAESRLREAESIFRRLKQDGFAAFDYELASTLDDYARLFQQTDRLEKAKEKSREAAEIWRELVSRNARFGEKVASTLEYFARICFKLEEFENAENALRDALEIRRTRKETPELARTLNDLGVVCRRRGDSKETERRWLEARDIYRNLATEARGVYDEEQTRLLSALGDLYLEQEKYEKAEENYYDASVLYRGLARDGAAGRELNLARTLDNLGRVCRALRRTQDAEVYWREALELYLNATKENAREFKPRVAEITRRLAFVDLEAERVDDAEREFVDALELERELVREGSRQVGDELAEILRALADIRFADDRLGEAEAEYREALEIRRKQAQESPEKYEREVAATLVSLATLHRQVNRLSESDAEFQIALETYRDLAKKESRTFKPKLAFVLKNLAELHDEFNRKTKADVEFNEATTIYRELNEETSGAFDAELVATLRRWAEFCRKSNRATDAKEKYREIAVLGRKSPVETRSDEYFDALFAWAETLEVTEENAEASNVYRELIQAFCQKNAFDRKTTTRFADALIKSSRLRFDSGEYELVAAEYEALAKISRALASSEFEPDGEELRRARQTLLVAYDA